MSVMRKIASLQEAPTLDSISSFFPRMGEKRLSNTLERIKKIRKEMADAIDNIEPVKGLHNPLKNGIIYLVEHELYDGWIKCGMTVNMKTRIGSYNCNDPLKRFKVVIEKDVNDRRKSESLLKYNLKNASSLSNGEWYRINKDEALKIFNNVS
jgi:hypothetical protein